MIDIEKLSNEELQKVWNGVAKAFEQKRGLKIQSRHPIGFLMLSRETDRRGLELVKGRFGEIILKQKQ